MTSAAIPARGLNGRICGTAPTEGYDMPVYAFLCETCGSFEVRRPFSQASDPAQCPRCRAAATRLYTAPNVPRTPPAIASAMLRAEKSAYEPEVVRRSSGGDAGTAPTPQRSTGRPWMIGH